MSSDYRKVLLDSNTAPFVLKGLRSPLIREPSVSLSINGEPVGPYQALEVFEKLADSPCYPQTIADIISSSYLRLTYQKSDTTSATFGTSIVGALSFRTTDGELHFIPAINQAAVFTEPPYRLTAVSTGRYGEMASISAIRTYETEAMLNQTKMVVELSFTALQDIHLQRSLLSQDAFRLCTISSMFSTRNRYDCNVIRYTRRGETKYIRLEDTVQRGCYLFAAAQPCQEFELVKETGSAGKQNTPGAPDSPSIRGRILESSLPMDEFAVQAYLDTSVDIDEDSLTSWIEWLKCPPVIERGRVVSVKIEFSAEPPEEQRPTD